MHGETLYAVRKKGTLQLWSKGTRPIDYGSREEAERQIDRLVAAGARREELEVYVERIPY